MSQLSFSDEEYSGRIQITKREEFLKTMNEIIPWAEWVERIRPFYPSGKRGRPVRGIEMMLRMYLLQIWFGLSDEGTGGCDLRQLCHEELPRAELHDGTGSGCDDLVEIPSSS